MGKAVAITAMLIFGTTCVSRVERKISPTLQTVDLAAEYLKIHMKNGDVFVLTTWTIDEPARAVTGSGTQFGPDRVEIRKVHSLRIRFDDVALYETNTIETSPGVAAMAVVTGLSLVVSAACILNPKACFGSCPTFYARADDGRMMLQAEGFSDAISPALETHDIDSLWRTTGHGGRFTLRMTNEAYETHVVKQADLLVVPRPRGGRVLATAEELWTASTLSAPTTCTAGEGSCLDAVRAIDGRERSSVTDEHDLAARETIELTFPVANRPAAVVIAARQSLVTTFLLYQGLAYLGTTAASWLAMLERGNPFARAGGRALQDLVGGIEVQIWSDGTWKTVGEAYETGPLATDVHLVMLPEDAHGEHVRLRLPQGGWRIDAVALATITGKVDPVRIAPVRIHGVLGAEYAGRRVPARAFPIVTMPGDAYDLDYVLPPGDDYELFVDSRGYYLEWMRAEWIREEAPLSALRMLLDPAQAMKDLAPAYKKLEPNAEELFWKSRYAHP